MLYLRCTHATSHLQVRCSVSHKHTHRGNHRLNSDSLVNPHRRLPWSCWHTSGHTFDAQEAPLHETLWGLL